MKTTKAHFRYFNKQVLQWSDFFGLPASWKVFTTHTDLPEKNLAETFCDYPSKIATVYLGRDWSNNEVTEKELDETAFHEVCEIILDGLDSMAKIACKHENVDIVRHTIIQTLTASLFRH